MERIPQYIKNGDYALVKLSGRRISLGRYGTDACSSSFRCADRLRFTRGCGRETILRSAVTEPLVGEVFAQQEVFAVGIEEDAVGAVLE